MNKESSSHIPIHAELSDFPKDSLLKKVLVTEIDFETSIGLKPGDYASRVELKDGRKFTIFSRQDGRCLQIGEDVIDAAGKTIGEILHSTAEGEEEFHDLIIEIHDALLTADLPEEVGVALAMKDPE